jgi:endogenous inhibitor of DNA gyrase (YacG/DUF329 family)
MNLDILIDDELPEYHDEGDVCMTCHVNISFEPTSHLFPFCSEDCRTAWMDDEVALAS